MTLQSAWTEWERTLQTGDLVFFHGIFRESVEIEIISRSEWSHVGMVVRLPGFDEALLWESTTTATLEDVEEHRIKTGPMLVRLRERIATDEAGRYDSRYAFRQLIGERQADTLDKFQAFVEEVHDASFPSLKRMAEELLAGRWDCQADEKTFFCSELVAETYMRLGWMKRAHPSNAYSPKLLAVSHELPLAPGMELARELRYLKDVEIPTSQA
ncbi:hypothetical protein HGI30_14780 [Paenibacillus albicereus]|uniref:Permuted papain-like amidase YaeF/Yiix C92 family enzyme n=1 Tax=Paenibacillus albicereus TaxID=2726185 RepID=A0A6H2GZ41_9BACL|nr:hypothetical protein [Paenibacillus albicereus]QJC52703.1 hypothetical protein HGI30_14780 [Paenibacillus albicereus]